MFVVFVVFFASNSRDGLLIITSVEDFLSLLPHTDTSATSLASLLVLSLHLLSLDDLTSTWTTVKHTAIFGGISFLHLLAVRQKAVFFMFSVFFVLQCRLSGFE